MDASHVRSQLLIFGVALDLDADRPDGSLWTSPDGTVQLEWNAAERLFTARRMFAYPYAEMPPLSVLRFSVTDLERGAALWCVCEGETVGQALAGVGLNPEGCVSVSAVRRAAADGMRALADYHRGLDESALVQVLQDLVDAVRAEVRDA